MLLLASMRRNSVLFCHLRCIFEDGNFQTVWGWLRGVGIVIMELGDLVNFKIIVLGAQGVGKSTLITRYIKGEFAQHYHVTVGVEYATKVVPIEGGQQIRLQIWDTAGQELFRALVRSFYKGISAVFFVYAIDNEESFRELKAWSEEVRQNAHEEVIVFLIGARADNEDKREVDSQAAASFVREIQGALYVQTSAKSGQNIDLLFKRAAEMLYKKYRSNASFRKLVQPDLDQNGMRDTRGKSIILKQATVKQNVMRRDKKRCCE